MSTPARTRLTADERRRQAVAVALRHFAAGGYHGTSTEAIAAEAGVSQPYLFRLFGTKRELFKACCTACNERIVATFDAAAARAPHAAERMHEMGRAYIDLLADRHLLRFQLQMYAACQDDDIRAHVRTGYRALVAHVRELAPVSEPQLWTFFATGMMLNVVATLQLEEVAGEDAWAAAWSDPRTLLDAPPC